MSVLIKGMEMPKACYYCQFLWFKTPDEEGGEGMCDLLEKWVAEVCNRPDWCPLVEVPKHGRLIDVDEFEKYVELEYETREISHPNWIKFRVWCGDQPTIIEAEG